MLGAAAVLSLGAGALAGVLPAIRAARTAAVAVAEARRCAQRRRRRAVFARLLLGVEAAFSVMLLIGAALLMRSFVALVNVDPGYDPANVLTGRVYVTGAAATPARRGQLVRDRSRSACRSAPGVDAAGVSNMAPLGESSFVSGFSFGINAAGQRVVARALQYIVTAGYAEALGMRLKEGRLLQPADETSPLQAMLVNEAFVRDLHERTASRSSDAATRVCSARIRSTTEIVGVVGDVLKDGLDAQAQAEMYLAHGEARGHPPRDQCRRTDRWRSAGVRCDVAVPRRGCRADGGAGSRRDHQRPVSRTR